MSAVNMNKFNAVYNYFCAPVYSQSFIITNPFLLRIVLVQVRFQVLMVVGMKMTVF
jgi:hypothetical protein